MPGAAYRCGGGGLGWRSRARGGVEELRGRVGNSVEQVASERAEAGGRAHAAGSAEQRERGDCGRASEAAGDKQVGMKLVDVGRLPLRAGARRRQRVRTHPFHTTRPLPHRGLC